MEKNSDDKNMWTKYNRGDWNLWKNNNRDDRNLWKNKSNMNMRKDDNKIKFVRDDRHERHREMTKKNHLRPWYA